MPFSIIAVTCAWLAGACFGASFTQVLHLLWQREEQGE